jgi:hypothetical protein
MQSEEDHAEVPVGGSYSLYQCKQILGRCQLRTPEIDIADTVNKSDKADFLTNAAWTLCSPYHTVLKTLPGAAIFQRDMLFDIPFLADW